MHSGNAPTRHLRHLLRLRNWGRSKARVNGSVEERGTQQMPYWTEERDEKHLDSKPA